MTHTLNRIGIEPGQSSKEYIFLCMIPAADKGRKTSEMAEICKILIKHKPSNMIGLPSNLDEAGLIKMAERSTILTAVFIDQKAVEAVIKEIKNKEFGISIVVSGLFDEIHTVCQNTGTCEHTHNISLGVFGKTDRLPDKQTMEITTQCGHALISSHYVDHIVKQIKKGKLTCEEGMKKLVKPCVCGIANPDRIKASLEKMTSSDM